MTPKEDSSAVFWKSWLMTTLACSPRLSSIDDAGVLVGLVAQVADAVDLLFGDQFGDAGHEGGAVHVVGDLGDDDLLHAALELLGVGLAADADDALAGPEVAQDALAAGDDAAGGEIRPLDDLAELVHGDARVGR